MTFNIGSDPESKIPIIPFSLKSQDGSILVSQKEENGEGRAFSFSFTGAHKHKFILKPYSFYMWPYNMFSKSKPWEYITENSICIKPAFLQRWVVRNCYI